MNERTKCVLGSGCALLLAVAASAATWNVSTAVTDGMTGPQQITNALTQCQSGDTILVEPGTYDFTGIYMDEDNKIHLTRNANPIKTFSLVGNTDSHWAGGGGGILFEGDGQLGDFWQDSAETGWRGPYPVIANIAFKGFKTTKSHGGALRFREWKTMEHNWPIVTNCVFRNCSTTERGGAIFGGVKAFDCLFVTNAANNGGALDGGSAYGSTFEGNSAARGGAMGFLSDAISSAYSGMGVEISNCVFRANATQAETGALNGGALCFENVGGHVMDCAFVSNKCTQTPSYYPLGGAIAGAKSDPVTVERCAFEGNESGWNGGAVSCGTIQDSTFKGNFSQAGGGAIFNCTAARCAFDGDYSTLDYRQPGSAYQSTLTDCTVRGSVCESAATRCVFQDVDYAAAYAVFFNQNWVTNSLIVRCGASLRGIAYAYNAMPGDTEFVNCTFADNVPDAYWGLFTSANEGNGNPIRAVNCIFTGTVDSHGVAADLTGRNLKAGDVKLDHCAYGAAGGSFAAFWTNVDASSFVWAKPRFAKGGGCQLRPSSPLRGKGLLLDGMADDLDLAGKPRVRDGKVDLGCYQCWTDPLGVLFLVR